MLQITVWNSWIALLDCFVVQLMSHFDSSVDPVALILQPSSGFPGSHGVFFHLCGEQSLCTSLCSVPLTADGPARSTYLPRAALSLLYTAAASVCRLCSRSASVTWGCLGRLAEVAVKAFFPSVFSELGAF